MSDPPEDPHAGIYYHPEAEEQYDELPDESQDRLSAFLEVERQQLEAHGGGNREGLAAEWEPGHIVYCDISLQPQYRNKPPHLRPRGSPSPPPRTLGSYYWIEVLEIR
jgi:hypothetical protein